MPNLYIIAGCNGAGKTTASYTVLPELLNCKEFVNADEIARGLSPFRPENVGFEAGRIMLNRIDELVKQKKDFAFETTLSTRSYLSFIRLAKKQGYKITLVFLWLKSADVAKERVKQRVAKGGHNIPQNIIERRYKRGMENFFKIFWKEIDYWLMIDNNKTQPLIVAGGEGMIDYEVKIPEIWKKIKKQAHEKK